MAPYWGNISPTERDPPVERSSSGSGVMDHGVIFLPDMGHALKRRFYGMPTTEYDRETPMDRETHL